MAQGAYRPRNAKVSKFPTALDINSGELVSLKHLKVLFFAAAQSANPEKAIKSLREEFKLVCPHCKKARLTFSFGSQNPDGSINPIAGSDIPGNPAHLKTKGSKGKDRADNVHAPKCIGVVMDREGHEINADKGYCIYLNLKQIPERNPRNKQLVMRDRDGKIVVLDPDLKDREPWSITKVEKVLPLMRSGQIQRLENSVIVHGDRKTPWFEFLIPANAVRDQDNPHLTQFARSFFANPNVGHPILANFDFSNCTMSNYQDEHGKAKHYKFPRIAPFNVKGLGQIIIQPELRVQNEHLFTTIDAIHRGFKEVLVLAEKPFIYKRDSKTNIYTMTVVLRDPDMMVEASLKDIMAIAKKRYEAAHPTPNLLAQPQP